MIMPNIKYDDYVLDITITFDEFTCIYINTPLYLFAYLHYEYNEKDLIHNSNDSIKFIFLLER